MKTKFAVILVVLFFSLVTAQQKFHINLNDRADDLFKVTVYPDNLSADNSVFHFAATAPGMYQIIDAGRFIKYFKAFDEHGNEIKTELKSLNEYELSEPEKIYKIEYNIAETWDTPVEDNFIYPMGGTSIEDDHAVINGHLVFGYFEGKQSDPIFIKIISPAEWETGTALKENSAGYFEAYNFDHLVDSPIMSGKLSTASINIDNTIIDIYTYSKTDVVESQHILESADEIFHALNDFVEDMPIDRYVFLFHFEDLSAGALEHSYSSFYVYKESTFDGRLENSIRDVIAHEIFHMITPLNIHSEIIEQFNFANPVLSQHLWLYEGVTEWASHMMQLRAGLITLDDHLKTLQKKLTYNDFYDSTISLKQLSLNSFELQSQFQIVYQRGSVVAELLDLKLLQLSNGTRGLREVINELSDDYGADDNFDEENFFNEFVERTYPEIKDFIAKYIVDAQPLPVKEYFELVGIDYYKSRGVDSSRISPGFGIGVEGERLVITSAPVNSNVQNGDIILKVEGDELNLLTYRKVFGLLQKKKPGDEIKLLVKRDNEEKEIMLDLKPSPINHVFEINPNTSTQQLELREVWLKNL